MLSSRSFSPLDAAPPRGALPPQPWNPGRLGRDPVAAAEPPPETAAVPPDGDGGREDAAFARGYAEGQQQAQVIVAERLAELAVLEADVQQVREGFQAEFRAREQRLEEEYAALRHQAQLYVIEIAVKVAERLLRAQLRLAPDTVIRVAREALAEAEGGDLVRARVAPSDLEVLQEAAAGLAAETGVGRLEVAARPGLERGEVELETGTGTLDARWSTQLERARRGLRQAAGGGEGQ
ncbi:MAG TPA: FliH/SctL family protein [Bacillota bacterium]|nr:FliH/SctL family protein [Bacillota bacterium]